MARQVEECQGCYCALSFGFSMTCFPVPLEVSNGYPYGMVCGSVSMHLGVLLIVLFVLIFQSSTVKGDVLTLPFPWGPYLVDVLLALLRTPNVASILGRDILAV